MYLKIRKYPENADVLINISRTSTILELQEKIQKIIGVEIECQTLLYKGKKLIKDQIIFDYGIKLNDVVQLIVTEPKLIPIENKPNDEDLTLNATDSTDKCEVSTESKYYLNKDAVDFRDSDTGVWHEARIVDILKQFDEWTGYGDAVNLEPEVKFRIRLERQAYLNPFDVSFNDIRPRSYYKYQKIELKPGMTVLANYNIDRPNTLGSWLDFNIKKVNSKGLTGTILAGRWQEASIDGCTVSFGKEREVMRIEPVTLLTYRNSDSFPKEIAQRKIPYHCVNCRDDDEKNCKECSCRLCGGKHALDTLLLCDQCELGYHMACLDPPLATLPPDNWYCPNCKTDENEIVQAGEKTKFSKKKAKMPSSKKTDSKRDWGHGMGCTGRTTECTIVSKDHYGPIPNVEVGTTWKYRLQVSEAGIHRPLVAGIHGRESDGAYSIVLSGGYEDDIDKGDEFYYTGSGGRDLKEGNKRMAAQTSDQELTGSNKALALNCNAKFNDKVGAKAAAWKAGRPVRVVRSCGKSKKHKSDFAPDEGFRYDGIYKVVRYYPEMGKAGFLVWRYFLKRDDENPAPWTEQGHELPVIYPEGYFEALALKQKEKEERKVAAKENGKVASVKKKRVLSEASASPTNVRSSSNADSLPTSSSSACQSVSKRAKLEPYKLSEGNEKLIASDAVNEKLWQECKEVAVDGKVRFLNKVTETFNCIVCQEVLYEPVTTPCKHNICKPCLRRAFKSEMYSCPSCRHLLGNDYKMDINEELFNVLLDLFPGYQIGR